MNTDYTIENIETEQLYKIIVDKKESGYRLTQICATAFEGYNEIIYSVSKDYDFENFKIVLPIDEEIISLSDIFPSAMLYENEMKELFGVKIKGISLDYNNKFFRIDKETPFKKQIKVIKKEEKEDKE